MPKNGVVRISGPRTAWCPTATRSATQDARLDTWSENHETIDGFCTRV